MKKTLCSLLVASSVMIVDNAYAQIIWLTPNVGFGSGHPVFIDNWQRRHPRIIIEEVIQQPLHRQCTAWREIQNSDGSIYRERICF